MINVTPTALISKRASADIPVAAAIGAAARPLIPSDRPPVGTAANAPIPSADVIMPNDALLSLQHITV